jgi:hypothetical protein
MNTKNINTSFGPFFFVENLAGISGLVIGLLSIIFAVSFVVFCRKLCPSYLHFRAMQK